MKVLFYSLLILLIFQIVAPAQQANLSKIQQSGGQLTRYGQTFEVDFPHGYEVQTHSGKVVKMFRGYQKAKVKAHIDFHDSRVFISDWSYDRWTTRGTPPNYIVPYVPITPPTIDQTPGTQDYTNHQKFGKHDLWGVRIGMNPKQCAEALRISLEDSFTKIPDCELKTVAVADYRIFLYFEKGSQQLFWMTATKKEETIENFYHLVNFLIEKHGEEIGEATKWQGDGRNYTFFSLIWGETERHPTGLKIAQNSKSAIKLDYNVGSKLLSLELINKELQSFKLDKFKKDRELSYRGKSDETKETKKETNYDDVIIGTGLIAGAIWALSEAYKSEPEPSKQNSSQKTYRKAASSSNWVDVKLELGQTIVGSEYDVIQEFKIVNSEGGIGSCYSANTGRKRLNNCQASETLQIHDTGKGVSGEFEFTALISKIGDRPMAQEWKPVRSKEIREKFSVKKGWRNVIITIDNSGDRYVIRGYE